ncbi:sugar-binding domain-containing protein [Lutibacter citreus]|uniref:sugar-binding domain-containing protein n=1 Tax=Lutibacter citreus TaxID=2138210 RepID=UPI000DBE36BC|nr:sugar-binding domain-containing protein [Lutibacter citreus]
MKRLKTLTILSAVLVLVLFTACNKILTKNTNENFDFGWKFKAGDIEGVESSTFKDTDWRDVDLPHDWSIEGNFSKDNPSHSRGAWLPTGKVMYRKTFKVSVSQKDKRFVIYFDGAYRNSEVFINGHLLGKRPMGYIAFHYDMTEHINFGSENVISVKLDNSSQPGSRWYTGTGIYRHVNLISTNKIYVPVWGNYIVADNFTSSKADIKIETSVQNDLDENKVVIIRQKAFTLDGKLVAKTTKDLNIEPGKTIVKTILKVPNPQIWSSEIPNLYTIETEILDGKNVVYSERNKTGIRTLEFSATDGFKLNGKVTKLKGVCLHHAGGPLGAAVHRRTTERQLEKLQEMGCNAIRTAHNPFSTEFLKVCDSMGFLVMNEMFDEWEKGKSPGITTNGKKSRLPVDYYAKQFKEWADRDLSDFILRDRNHPSVIMWSIGNEILEMKNDKGALIGKRLADIVHKLDYRPTTNGVNGYGGKRWPSDKSTSTSDIRGYNYMWEPTLDKERELVPDGMAVITECVSEKSFYPRGTHLYGESKKAFWDKLNYEDDESYNWAEREAPISELGIAAWRDIKHRKYVMGQFIWTGWDYLGEVIPYGWPARSSSFGVIDLAGFPKDAYYFYQSQWTNKPMVHIFPHWNLIGMERDLVKVYAFTNGDAVELFQDGKSLGKQKNDVNEVEYQTWEVVYKSGELKALSYKNGKVIAEKIVKTAGEATSIKVETRRVEMKANGQDLIYVECTILDKDGNEVPTANNLIEFYIGGPAKIVGVGNGDNMGLEPFKANKRTAFNGKCLAIIQSTKEAGSITCTISSEKLGSTSIHLNSYKN